MKIFYTYLKLILVSAIFLLGCNSNKSKSDPINSLKQVFHENKYDSTKLEEVFNKLNTGSELSKSEIEDYSKSIETRANFYNLLTEFNKENLFPDNYYTFEKASESILTNWLLYPTELDTIPSRIELLKKVNFIENDSTFIYYVFQFKTEEPHWAAKDGWMIGVVGPYFKNSKPYDWTTGTFSKFSKMIETTPEKEVEWIHKNVFRRSSK